MMRKPSPFPGYSPGLSRAAALAVALLAIAGGMARAQDAKPQRKDTSERLKPKEVVLSATVEPATAKPGETVTYTVTAKVEKPWHIYAFAKAQPAEGPRATQFDFFQAGGLKPGTDAWKPAKPPVRKKEPAFPDLDAVEFYESEASWSIPLQIPAGTPPGVKELQSQIYFQICNDSVCKPPSYVTVPAVKLTIAGGGASLRSALPGLLTGLVTPPIADDPQPSKKETPEKLRPREVTLKTAVVPAEAAPGSTVEYQVTAQVEPGWHLYAYSAQPASDGPLSTQFDFYGTGGLEPLGDWKPSTEPTLRREEAFPDLPFVAFHEGTVTWTRSLRIPADARAGKVPLKSQIQFQICTDQNCMPPANVNLPEAVLTIAGEAVAAAPEAADVEKERPVAAAAPEAPSKSMPAVASTSAETKDQDTAQAGSKAGAEERIEQGLVPFLVWSALGGLFALMMPCVWPMIPVTVNFFVKQGQKGQGKTTGLAITYCLAIIGIFTLVGLVFSAFFGASALTRLANNAWLNLAVGLLFVAFGLSLLGLFEISLPSWMLNASSKGESRGGLVGVIFMALTLTITSFTCTFPVVGSLVVMAARGNYLYPVIGLATFATVLALPFFLLALAPGLIKKMPKSGGWMNSIKVVGGLVEIGAAFKFLNAAEIGFGSTPESCWIDSAVLLAVWVVLAMVCGLYLLGIFRTDHDDESAGIGPVRLVGGALFLAMGLYLAPALFGYPPKSQIYNRLVVGLLPGDSNKLDASDRIIEEVAARIPVGNGTLIATGNPGQAPARRVKATSTDPEVAVREEKLVHGGIVWGLDYDSAIAEAKASGKPVLIDFTGVNCANCRLMEKSVIPDPKVAALLREFVTIQLYTDFVPIDSINQPQREELAEANSLREVDMTSEQTMPLYVIVTPDEQVVARKGGFIEVPNFTRFLQDGLDAAKGGSNRVASARP
ncbi:MAG: cytochrome c biogenesis protein CcdA [Isosphaeraceae bacterium]